MNQFIDSSIGKVNSDFYQEWAEEGRRAIKEKSFTDLHKKKWKSFYNTYFKGPKKLKESDYFKGLVDRIKFDNVEDKDYDWMETEMLPVVEQLLTESLLKL